MWQSVVVAICIIRWRVDHKKWEDISITWPFYLDDCEWPMFGHILSGRKQQQAYMRYKGNYVENVLFKCTSFKPVITWHFWHCNYFFLNIIHCSHIHLILTWLMNAPFEIHQDHYTSINVNNKCLKWFMCSGKPWKCGNSE